jgi:hypothetical protein
VSRADGAEKALALGGKIAGGVMGQLLDAGINGVGKLPGAKSAAAKAFGKHQDTERAISSLVTTHVSLASAQGFVTNLGGILAAAVGIPANVAAIAVIQIRLVAAIAHLRGYDIDSPRVRTAMSVCLLGQDGVNRLIRRGDIPSTPLAIATAPVHDATLALQINERVLGELFGNLGGRRAAVMFARRVPLLGGGVAGTMDGWSTKSLANYAREQFPRRRPITR